MTTNNKLKDSDYEINFLSIKYVSVIIVHNQDLTLFEQFINYWNSEYIINSNDKIIFEFLSDNQVFEFDPNKPDQSDNPDLESNIKFNYYSYGVNPLFPKSIKSSNSNPKIYIQYIEPITIENKIVDKYIGFILQNNNQKNIIDGSRYTCTYYNIYNKQLAFGIGKVKYQGKFTSRFIIGYESTLFNQQQIMLIIRKIIV